jgi:large subunit ribosomal protein L35
MPKQKVNSAAKKRFKVTGTGRILRRHAMKSHNLEKKTAKRKRAFSRDEQVARADAREARRLLGG